MKKFKRVNTTNTVIIVEQLYIQLRLEDILMTKKKKLVPESAKALKALKYEIASEIGIIPSGASVDYNSEFADELGRQTQSVGVGHNIDWGSISSRQNGYIGGSITKKLVQQAQQNIYK